MNADDYEITVADDTGGAISLKPAWAFGTGMVFLSIDPRTVNGVYPRADRRAHRQARRGRGEDQERWWPGMTDEEIAELVARAERESWTPRLYRLWCEHAGVADELLWEGDCVPCLGCGPDEGTVPVMYRITPQTEPRHWPDWRNE